MDFARLAWGQYLLCEIGYGGRSGIIGVRRRRATRTRGSTRIWRSLACTFTTRAGTALCWGASPSRIA
jgi:hypothetical protein